MHKCTYENGARDRYFGCYIGDFDKNYFDERDLDFHKSKKRSKSTRATSSAGE